MDLPAWLQYRAQLHPLGNVWTTKNTLLITQLHESQPLPRLPLPPFLCPSTLYPNRSASTEWPRNSSGSVHLPAFASAKRCSPRLSSTTTFYCHDLVENLLSLNWSLIVPAWLVLIYYWVTHTPEAIEIKTFSRRESADWRLLLPVTGENGTDRIPFDECLWRKSQPSVNGKIKCSHNLTCLL